MKNGLKLLIGVVVIVLGVVLLKSKNTNPFIEKNEEKITEIESTQDSLFVIADNIIDKVSKTKEQNNQLIEDLNGEINTQQIKLDGVRYSLNEKMDKISDMKVVCQSHIEVIGDLEEKNIILSERLNQYKKEYSKVVEENLVFYEKIKNLEDLVIKLSEIQSEIQPDTIKRIVYQIDTIFYRKDQIKVLKIRR